MDAPVGCWRTGSPAMQGEGGIDSAFGPDFRVLVDSSGDVFGIGGRTFRLGGSCLLRSVELQTFGWR